MTTMRLLALACLLCALAGCAGDTPDRADAGRAAGAEAVVVAPGPDDGEQDAFREYPEWDGHPAVAEARAAARAFWQRHEMGLEEDFAVVSVAEGRFVDGAEDEQVAVLYRMSTSPSCCVRMGLAIVAADRLVRNVAFDGGATSLRAVPDLDGDGRDELAVGWSGGGQGYWTSGFELVALGDGGAVREWGRLETGESDCGAMGNSNRRVRVLAQPGPTFTAQPFEGTCDDAALRAAGPPEPVRLEPPVDRSGAGLEWSVGYVTLPTE